MSDDRTNKPQSLLPIIVVHVMDHDSLVIGKDNEDVIREIRFYNKLNSFAMSAEISMIDEDNQLINRINEPNALTIALFKLPKGKDDRYLKKDLIFQKTFSISEIEVKRLGKEFPYKSEIKVHLVDRFKSLILNKICRISNFNLPFTSKKINPNDMMHWILKDYEKLTKEIVIPDGIYGFNKMEPLRRRFVTDCSTPMEDVFRDYISTLYDTQWIEFLSDIKKDVKFEMPKYMLAYSNQYTIDDDGVFRQRPYLTTVNILDDDNDKTSFSIPYPKKGKILEFAVKNYKINAEDIKIDLNSGLDAKIKEKFLAFNFVSDAFNPNVDEFIRDPTPLGELTQLNPKAKFDIETKQRPKYFGIGDDPDFQQINVYNQSILIERPFNIIENQYNFSNGSNSFYNHLSELLFRPMIYVSIPYSAWHSPGQEIDLKMIAKTNPNGDLPDKELLFSMNKLVSGRWKILNSITCFRKASEQFPLGMVATETLGLNRTKYFSGGQGEINNISTLNDDASSKPHYFYGEPKQYKTFLDDETKMINMEDMKYKKE